MNNRTSHPMMNRSVRHQKATTKNTRRDWRLGDRESRFANVNESTVKAVTLSYFEFHFDNMDAASPFLEESYFRERTNEEIQNIIRVAPELNPYVVDSESFHGDAVDTSDTLLPPLVPSPVTNVRSFSFLSNTDERDDHDQDQDHVRSLSILQVQSRRENMSRMPGFESMPPNLVPIDQPTSNDILFGRGGLTNHHPGNKRFRDIVSLHKDEYAEASKVLKPLVARKIVKAIRNAAPPGRFLMRNNYDNKWYDVGDRRAAEKASQALREKSQEEKKTLSLGSLGEERSSTNQAVRVPLPIDSIAYRREHNIDNVFNSSSMQNLPSLDEAHAAFAYSESNTTSQYLSLYDMSPYDPTVPDTLILKENSTAITVPLVDSSITRCKTLPELHQLSVAGQSMGFTDANGNIIVTEHDILCGRGGATNHHKGNKRFRDVVALHRQDYIRASKTQKPNVSRTIVRAIRSSEPPGRFLKKNDDGYWYDIGDQRAAEKVSQALREKNQEEKTDSDASTVGNILMTESLNNHDESDLNGSEYSSLHLIASNTDHRTFTHSTSQPVSPITFTHISSNYDHGCSSTDKIQAV